MFTKTYRPIYRKQYRKLFRDSSLTLPVIDSSLKLHLQAFGDGFDKDDLMVTDENDFVSQWTGINGSGNNATQSTQTDKPVYVSSGINGLPAISFDGVNDWLNLVNSIIKTDTFTMFVVFRSPSIKLPLSGSSYIFGTGFTTNRLYLTVSNTDFNGIINGRVGNTGFVVGTVADDLTPHIARLQHKGANQDLVLKVDDNPEEVEINNPATGATTSVNIGSFGQGFNGHTNVFLGELILYNKSFSSNEITLTEENYLSPKWRINI